MQFDLTDEEASALHKLLTDAIEYDQNPPSPRIRTLRHLLDKFGPIATPLPPPAWPPTSADRDPRRTPGLDRSGLEVIRVGASRNSCVRPHGLREATADKPRLGKWRVRASASEALLGYMAPAYFHCVNPKVAVYVSKFRQMFYM